MIITVYEPGDPGGDPVAVYRGVHAVKNGDGTSVWLDRWGSQWPIGSVSRLVTWEAWLTIPNDPGNALELVAKDIRTRKEAVQLLVETWHFRYRAHRTWEHKLSRPLVNGKWDLLPGGVSWRDKDQELGRLHRFLGVNRRLFDKPTEIKPYAGIPYEADQIGEEHIAAAQP